MQEITHIIIGTSILSIIHVLIPNHWIPVLLISKTERWSNKKRLWVTILVGISHCLSTLLIGIAVGFVGIKLYLNYNLLIRLMPVGILTFLGSIYIISDLIKPSHSHCINIKATYQKSRFSLLISLCIAMFFSPCIEIEAYYLVAAKIGWTGIILVSIIYFVITCLGMVLLINLAYQGIDKLRWHYLEEHEKRVTGFVLVILGLSELFL